MGKDEKEKLKLISFTKELEQAIEADAKRCRRSFVRQVEAVLTTYYGIENVEVDRERIESVVKDSKKTMPGKLEIIGELAPTSRRKIPTFEINSQEEKKAL